MEGSWAERAGCSLKTTARYLQLAYSYYRRGAFCQHPPVHLDIESTAACNLACIMCPHSQISRRKGHMDLSLYKRIIDEAAGFHVNDICLHLFGEPLLNPEIFEMIRHAKKFGINTLISTNATLLKGENLSDILSSGLDRLIISLDGATEETYEKIRRRADFEETLDGIMSFLHLRKELRSQKPHTVLQVIRMKDTEKEIGSFVERFREFPVDAIHIKELDSWLGQIEAIKDLSTTPPKKFGERYPCGALWYSMAIYWDGRVVPCCRDYDAKYVLGNISEEKLSSIWNNKKMQNLRLTHIRNEYETTPLCLECEAWQRLTPMHTLKHRIAMMNKQIAIKIAGPNEIPVLST